MKDYSDKQIVFFDGVCNLCTGAVQFVLKRNKKKNILFASLQSNAGQQLLAQYNLPMENFSSFLFLENGKLYKQSTGALRMLTHLYWPWPILYGFIIVPPFIRNGVYNWIASNRYKWFGKQEACWLPTPELKARFLP
jgi:predicted DCC family thiol-disulfide oxidoreductase YuxK